MDFYYELLLITIPDKLVGNSINKQVTKIFNKILKFEDWGIKKFAYKIKKHDEGIYLWYLLKTNTIAINKFRYEARINENIIRFLLLNLHKHVKNPKRYIENKLKTSLTEEEITGELAYREQIMKKRKKWISNSASNLNNNTT